MLFRNRVLGKSQWFAIDSKIYQLVLIRCLYIVRCWGIHLDIAHHNVVATAHRHVIALLGLASFVGFTRFASAIQVVTGIGIIWAYHLSRKRTGAAPLVGKFGTLPFQLLVIVITLLATVGSFVKVG